MKTLVKKIESKNEIHSIVPSSEKDVFGIPMNWYIIQNELSENEINYCLDVLRPLGYILKFADQSPVSNTNIVFEN